MGKWGDGETRRWVEYLSFFFLPSAPCPLPSALHIWVVSQSYKSSNLRRFEYISRTST
ncbi:hypothetical protein [Trichormus sp. NMC-1]|uniref:hypothetical protein n=1 Tax=Trichormus sp. NMC-1 TaxID=1853259 RepID=UPI0015A672F7|nr:hypothetical protein [Trichormus sp. NMC-1]